jgi:methionine-rich copper-binding protein CopC
MRPDMHKTIQRTTLAVVFALAATAAYAHAQLVKATPPVGATVASANEIRLTFSEGVESRFSKIALTAADGAAIALGAAKTESGDATVFVAPIAKPLPPGVYTVRWSAVSTDTHHTQGDFSFTVKP